MDDELTIGELAARTGLPVRTLRFWSDEGVLPPTSRSTGNYRLYDSASVARVDLVRALRELGLGLDEVGRVLGGRTSVAEVARAHVVAIDARIRALKVSRAVLSVVAERGASTEETALVNRLARLSTEERARVVAEFKEEVFGPLALTPEQRERMRGLRIDLPDDPSADQVDAWVELAELVGDGGFRERMRVALALSTPTPERPRPPGASIWWARRLVGEVGRAVERRVPPEGAEAAGLLKEWFPGEDLAAVLRSCEAGVAARMERYRVLVSRVRGERGWPEATGELEWLGRALRFAVAGEGAR
ncbi:MULTISPECIES: MerR family transcriptional regulator [Actinosynnema]|uniref:helix-turn-helix domain-containing protein n=1 Tax=Actinosynnema TaxID=40566 RepID=UPI0020A4E06D|nr:MerR family transcriptional regulator [Actinosynnema pretiosum]MCP2094445.1 DNA-binding transcriptional regulator, MerR family [Actinosynnema pretiosum]